MRRTRVRRVVERNAAIVARALVVAAAAAIGPAPASPPRSRRGWGHVRAVDLLTGAERELLEIIERGRGR